MNKMSGKWLIGVLCLMLAAPLAATPVGRLGVPAGPVPTGSSFVISVYADGVGLDEVIAFGFDLDYSNTWAFVGAAMGPGFPNDDSGSPTNTMVAGSVDPDPPWPSGDNVLLATLTLRPSVAGQFHFGIISDLSNKNQGLILFTGPTADLTTNIEIEVSAAPVPGSLALLILGLAALPLSHYRRAALAQRV